MLDYVKREYTENVGSDRSFGLVFTLVFSLIGVWPLIGNWNDLSSIRIPLLGVAFAVFLVSLIRSSLLAPANRAWMKIGFLLNKVISPLVMGLLFFVVLTPVALVMRLNGKDILDLKRNRDCASYWIDRDKGIPSSMKDQF